MNKMKKIFITAILVLFGITEGLSANNLLRNYSYYARIGYH